MKIPLAKPLIGIEERAAVLNALRQNEISGLAGTYVSGFEKRFANFSDCEYGVAVTNGTVALHLALATVGVGPGNEVLVSTFTNMATFFAILYVGATPVPIDIEPDTWNMNPALLESKLTKRTRAIMPVHIYGHPVDMDPILDIARNNNLFVIEDAAEAHGATYKDKRVGSLGDIGCFSFYANKILTTGEGGMLTTNNPDYAKKAVSLRSLAYGRENKFMHEAVGFNYRMSNLHAAIGFGQMAGLDKVIGMKRAMAKAYTSRLSGIPELQLPVEKKYARNVYWMFHVVLRGKAVGHRAEIMEALAEKGIETRVAFVPANQQKIFIKEGWTREGDCPVANFVGENGFYLPSGPELSSEEADYVCESLREVLKGV